MDWIGREDSTITVQSQTGISNAYCDPTWGAQRDIACKLKPTNKTYKDRSGDMVKASHEFVTDTEILPTDRVWIPGTDTTAENQARLVVDVATETLLDGSYQLWRGLLAGGNPA